MWSSKFLSNDESKLIYLSISEYGGFKILSLSLRNNHFAQLKIIRPWGSGSLTFHETNEKFSLPLLSLLWHINILRVFRYNLFLHAESCTVERYHEISFVSRTFSTEELAQCDGVVAASGTLETVLWVGWRESREGHSNEKNIKGIEDMVKWR